MMVMVVALGPQVSPLPCLIEKGERANSLGRELFRRENWLNHESVSRRSVFFEQEENGTESDRDEATESEGPRDMVEQKKGREGEPTAAPSLPPSRHLAMRSRG